MKNSILFFFFSIIFIIKGLGQIQEESYYYVVKQPVVIYPYDLATGTANEADYRIASLETPFNQLGDLRTADGLGQVYVIQILKMNIDNDPVRGFDRKINSDDQGNIFCIKSESYKPPAIIKHYKIGFKNGKPTFGTLVVPIKMRPKQDSIPFDFTTDFTLGTSFGYSMRISRFQPNYLNLVGVFGVTSVGVDSLSTNGYIKAPDIKLSSITPGIGAIIEMSNFQIGLVFGWDILGGITGKNWIYNGKTWISFGIGYQFIRKDS